MAKYFKKDKEVKIKIAPDRNGSLGEKKAIFSYNKIVKRYDLTVNDVIMYSSISPDMVLKTAEKMEINWETSS